MSKIPKRHPIARPAFILVVVSFLLSTTVSLVSLHMMSKRNERDMNKVLATQVYEYLSSEFSGPITAARTMSSNSFMVDLLEEESTTDAEAFAKRMAEYLSGIENGLGYQSAFVVSDVSRNYYTRDGLTRVIDVENDEQDLWYAIFMDNDLSYDLDVDADEKNKSDLIVYVNAKIVGDDKQPVGICGVGVHMTGLQELFRSFEEAFNVKISLVDTTGAVQVDTNSANIESANMGDLIKDVQKDDYEYHDLGGSKFAVTKYIDDLDWYLIVRSKGSSQFGKYANVVVLNLALCLFVLAVLFFALSVNRRQTKELATASLIDHLTGLFNKRTYAMDKESLESGPPDIDLVCMTADVNGLKKVNDTMGHDAGDELIRGAAECLRSCLGQYGTVYRIGGDEFFAFLHVQDGGLEELESDLTRTIDEWSGSLVDGVSLSWGFASARENPDEDLEGLCKISDERMYESKDRHYARTGEKRR